MRKIIVFILTLFVLSSFTSDSDSEKPLKSTLFDRDGYYFLVQENFIDYNTRIVSNPYLLEEYKEQLEIKYKDIQSTPQYHFLIIKDNKLVKRIGYFEPNQLKLGIDLDKAFEKVEQKDLQRLSKEEFIRKTNNFDKNGINWYGSELKKYDGEFSVYVMIKNEIEDKLGWTTISSTIYDKLVLKYPILTNRLDIFFSYSSPKDDFIFWKINILGNRDFEKTVKSMNFEEIEIISGFEYKGFDENSYYLTYFERPKK